MPNSTPINFADLGSAESVPIPNNYQGFHWLDYTIQGEFSGAPTTYLPSSFSAPPARVIHGFGFQMTAADNMSFDLNGLYIGANNGIGHIDITIKALRNTNQSQLEVIASFVVRAANEHSPNISAVSDLTFKNINQLQIFSNSMDSFSVGDISILKPNRPLPPDIHM